MSPATVLPTGWLVRLFKPHWNYTVLLDDHPVGKVGNQQARVSRVDPGKHILRMRFILLRRSKEIRLCLKEDEKREFLCGTSGLGWPTLREASPGDVAAAFGTSDGEPPEPADPVSPN